MVSGDDFQKVRGSSRLRLEVLTLIRGVENQDLDLAGLTETLGNISAGCPGEPLGEKQSLAPTLCSEKILKRLREKNIPPEEIAYICAAS